MKELFVVRHAKSSWADSSLRDYERPLNARGKRDAPFMASMMRIRENIPELIISSHAERAWKTAKQFKNVFMLSKEYVWKDPRLYHSDVPTIMGVVHEIPEPYKRVFIFGHNPGITQLANYFGNDIYNVPTAGILKLLSTAKEWIEMKQHNTEVKEIYFPKQFL